MSDEHESIGAGSPSLGRRELIELLGASVALAGLGACTQRPREKIFPYAQRPAEVTPGVPLHYATSMVLDGFALGILARSHEGRPTKIEGNPEHPASLGATGVYEQASVLDLYDPKRVRAVRVGGTASSWQRALAAVDQPSSFRPWIVLPPQSSPLIAELLARITQRYPAARVCFHSPLARRGGYLATKALFGRVLEPHYDFARARVTLSLGADFLSAAPFSARWARQFARARRRTEAGAEMPRLYVIESMFTPTGTLADHRLALAPSELPRVAAALLGEICATGPRERLPQAFVSALPRAQDVPQAAFVRALAADLLRVPGESVVVPGEHASESTHRLAHALNVACGNLGQTLSFADCPLLEPEGGATLEALAAALRSRQVDAVWILDCNPVYSSPPELELGRWLAEAPHSLHLSAFANETSRACRTVLPLSHYLESWGDARAYDGTRSLIQPLIEPLHATKSVIEVLAACAGGLPVDGHALLTRHHRSELGARFDAAWAEHLRLGFVPGSAFARVVPEASFEAAVALPERGNTADSQRLELNLEPSPCLYDGRFANNAWLLELPHPLTKQCWGNAAILSPATAARLGAVTGRVLVLEAHGRKLEVPALVLPGHAEATLTLSLGHGQTGDILGKDVGVNAYLLSAHAGSLSGEVTVSVGSAIERLAITQDYSDDRGRPLAPLSTLQHYREHPDFTAPLRDPQPSLLPVYGSPQRKAEGPQWAMTIDTTLCTGCSACVVACQSENNVPVVGQREVERGREMHWLRIDRYFSGPPERPRVVQQPMLCQHCENAPCEYVCPVNATVHSPDGLNEMVYNRCIGTRFCSNNCPYKVRRFNWFEYTGERSSADMQRNPDVTVRQRGVMEKCTYCVQRIRRAEITARVERRELRPGEVVTACQQACPTEAIQFGALQHAGTKMVQWRQEKRSYASLHDLGTRPRTRYLAKIFNTNPELEG